MIQVVAALSLMPGLWRALIYARGLRSAGDRDLLAEAGSTGIYDVSEGPQPGRPRLARPAGRRPARSARPGSAAGGAEDALPSARMEAIQGMTCSQRASTCFLS